MAREIFLVKDDIQKSSYLGWGWTLFFFGFWVPLFRKDLKGFGIILLATIVLSTFTYGGGGIIISIAAAIFYNNYSTEELIKLGFRPLDERSELELKNAGIFYN